MNRLFSIFIIISIGALFPLLAFEYSSEGKLSSEIFKYNLSKPQKNYVLPSVLNEISGITALNPETIACIQDETETIFIYDLKNEEVQNERSFNIKGDYEGIALVANTIYLLRSDGVLIEHADYTSSSVKTKEYQLNLPSPDNEGLCYDKNNNRLLIAAKSKTVKEVENKSIRLVYGFDLKTKILNSKPVFKLDVNKIEAKAKALHIPIPTRTIKKTGKEVSSFNFRPSEIAIHPYEDLIYILSASDNLLLIIDQKGNINNLLSLEPALFNKAEGITFLPDGDMLISNEAQTGKPTMLHFKYQN